MFELESRSQDEISIITKKTTITAQFDKYFEVTFIGYGGAVIETKEVKTGEAVTAPSVNKSVSDTTDNSINKFTGWDGMPDTVTKKTTVTAQYDGSPLSD